MKFKSFVEHTRVVKEKSPPSTVVNTLSTLKRLPVTRSMVPLSLSLFKLPTLSSPNSSWTRTEKLFWPERIDLLPRERSLLNWLILWKYICHEIDLHLQDLLSSCFDCVLQERKRVFMFNYVSLEMPHRKNYSRMTTRVWKEALWSWRYVREGIKNLLTCTCSTAQNIVKLSYHIMNTVAWTYKLRKFVRGLFFINELPM